MNEPKQEREKAAGEEDRKAVKSQRLKQGKASPSDQPGADSRTTAGAEEDTYD